MAFYKQDIVDINLNTGNIHRSFLNHAIGYKNDDADRFGIRTFRDGVPQDLTGASCQAVFMAPNGSKIALTSYGTVSGNVAYVTLPPACYDYEGQFCLAIQLVGGGVTGTMRIVDGMVVNTGASGTVAPTSSVPTYQEIIAQYDAMVAATAAANGAIAATYSGSATYKVGDYCIHDGGLYRCTTAITTAEAWNAAHWTATKIGPDVSDLKSAIDIFNPTLFPSYYPRRTTLHSGKGIKSDTGEYSGSSVLYYSDRFKVIPGTTIRLRNAFPGITTGGWGIAFYTNLLNATFSYISGVSYENGSNIDVVVPNTAHYCAITVHQNNLDIYSFGYEIENNLENVILLAEETAKKADCFANGRNLFDKTTITENKWVSGADGSLQSNNSYDTSDYIPITPGKVYTVSEKFSWAIFNSSKVYSRNGGTPTTFVAQSGDAFIRFSFLKANIDSVMFEENGFTGIYQPFDYRIGRNALMFDEVSTEPKNLFNPNVSVSGYLGTNGTIQISSDYKTSQFINVEAGQYYTCYGLFGSVHLYAADGTHSRGVSAIRYNGRNAVTFVPAEGETLVRLSYYKNDESIISIEKNIGLSSMTKNVADVVKPDRMDADSYKKTIVFVGSACYFTTISGALAAITDATEKNRYEIYIYPGTYEETFTTKDWVDIVGQNKYQCVINYTSSDESDYTNQSTIFAASNTRIANLTITTTGTKYPIHIDANYGKAYDLTVENCIVVHNGFTSVSAAGTGIGIGLHFGQNVLIKDCAVSGENVFGTASIYCHNDNENPSQAYSAYHRQLKVENCLLTQSYYGIRVGCVESYDGQDNSVILIGNVNKCTVPYYYTPGSYDSWHFFSVNNIPEYE